MHYILYQITNKLNGKIYVGVHKTKSLDDGYMGSGKVIRSAIAKHGIENFEKVILETFENAEAMYAREAELVNEEFLARDDVYNLRRGGHGGFEYINKMVDVVERNRKISSMRDYRDSEYLKRKSEATKQQWIDGRCSNTHTFTGYEFKGKTHSQETKNRIGEANSKLVGCKNSQYGTMWITNGIANSKIKKDSPIPIGWIRGRIKL